jgi:OPT family oligopeptide transporter
MALQTLTDEQLRTWSRSQKDAWWLKNIYRGDMPQLTLRAGLTGFFLGAILSATALYILAKTGIGIGVGLTSVILSFAVFRALSKAGLARDFTVLENNCTQSIATSAGYMVGALGSALPAYMLMTGTIIAWWQMMIWMTIGSILGVLVAFPMKRRFINEEQLPFPEGRAVGVVLDSLYTGNPQSGEFKARLLAWSALVAGGYQMLISDGWMKLIQFKILMMDQWAVLKAPWHLNERLDSYYYATLAKAPSLIGVPTINGVDIRQLGLRFTLDAAMLGVGGLMGIKVATSVLLGGFINYAVLAPFIIKAGDIAPRALANGTVIVISRGEIVNQWSLWWGVAMMVVASLVSLIAKPEIFRQAIRSLKRLGSGKQSSREPSGSDQLNHIEVPLWISYLGVPVFSIMGAWATHAFFGVPWLLAFISLPLIFVLTIICTNAMALTSWAPVGALSKITQFSMGAIDRANPASNLIPAGMTSEVASNAANLLSDIKPGYMLGAKPRQQAIGHVIGIIAGALSSVPLFFLLFLPTGANGLRATSTIVSEQFSMPAAMQWKGVAELIANGMKSLPQSALIAMAVAAFAALAIEIAVIRSKGRFPLSAVSIGLGVVLPPDASFIMWIGALVFWWMGRKHATPGSKGHDFWVAGCEPICAGLISGAALMGIGNAILNVLI